MIYNSWPEVTLTKFAETEPYSFSFRTLMTVFIFGVRGFISGAFQGFYVYTPEVNCINLFMSIDDSICFQNARTWLVKTGMMKISFLLFPEGQNQWGIYSSLRFVSKIKAQTDQ